MNDECFSDVSSVCSDLSNISDLDIEYQSVSFDLSNGSPIDIDNFNIVHFNINSITADNLRLSRHEISWIISICDEKTCFSSDLYPSW